MLIIRTIRMQSRVLFLIFVLAAVIILTPTPTRRLIFGMFILNGGPDIISTFSLEDTLNVSVRLDSNQIAVLIFVLDNKGGWYFG